MKPVSARGTQILLALLLLIHSIAMAADAPKLLLRLDDNGMNHAVNMAIQQVAETGIPFSTSVMFTCPWYQEAVDILKQHSNVSVGVHLVLNSEWKYYRWGPVLGKTAVPSLVDESGFFLASSDAFLASHYKLDEVERELQAQIERGLSSGLKIDYIDYHMLTAVSAPQLRTIVEKLAHKYKLGMSRYFGENYQSMFDVSVEQKKNEFFKRIGTLPKDKMNLLVMHVAQNVPEMQALVDMNDAGMHSDTKPVVAMHRSTELSILLSNEFQDLVKQGKIRLITYKEVVQEMGVDHMKMPEDFE
jgi:predicted glycoside hydrolase/deacetylase ChbG (UPF0249 family)